MNAHWTVKRLADIFEIARGGSPRPIESFLTDDPKGLNWIKIGDATASGKFIKVTKEKIRPEGLSKSRFVNSGDFLLTNSMSFGRPYIMATDGCIHDGWLVLKPRDRKLVDQDYFYHLLGSNTIYEMLSARAAGSTVKNLNTEIVSNLEIKLPPLDEQRRIAGILDKADELRRKRERAFNLLDDLTQSIFLEMFGDPIENTKQLPIAPLENVVSSTRKITYGILKPGPDHAGGVPYVRVVDIRNSLIDVAGLRRTTTAIAAEYKRSTLRGGDLLISIRGHVGRMAITPPECDGANITQDTARLAISGANTEFVKAQLETDPAKHWMAQRTKGAAVKGINLGDLRQFPLILPPRELQDEFADKIGVVRMMLKKSTGQNDNLDFLFSSLQSLAFSGRL